MDVAWTLVFPVQEVRVRVAVDGVKWLLAAEICLPILALATKKLLREEPHLMWIFVV